jgi:hypothetical protein
MHFNIRLILVASAVAALGSTQSMAEPLTAKQFDQLWNVIRPKPGEDKWDAVAWRADLWAARKEAAAQGKPLLLWEMDGHPLGCT